MFQFFSFFFFVAFIDSSSRKQGLDLAACTSWVKEKNVAYTSNTKQNCGAYT